MSIFRKKTSQDVNLYILDMLGRRKEDVIIRYIPEDYVVEEGDRAFHEVVIGALIFDKFALLKELCARGMDMRMYIPALKSTVFFAALKRSLADGKRRSIKDYSAFPGFDEAWLEKQEGVYPLERALCTDEGISYSDLMPLIDYESKLRAQREGVPASELSRRRFFELCHHMTPVSFFNVLHEKSPEEWVNMSYDGESLIARLLQKKAFAHVKGILKDPGFRVDESGKKWSLWTEFLTCFDEDTALVMEKVGPLHMTADEIERRIAERVNRGATVAEIEAEIAGWHVPEDALDEEMRRRLFAGILLTRNLDRIEEAMSSSLFRDVADIDAKVFQGKSLLQAEISFYRHNSSIVSRFFALGAAPRVWDEVGGENAFTDHVHSNILHQAMVDYDARQPFQKLSNSQIQMRGAVEGALTYTFDFRARIVSITQKGMHGMSILPFSAFPSRDVLADAMAALQAAGGDLYGFCLDEGAAPLASFNGAANPGGALVPTGEVKKIIKAPAQKPGG